ncbi:Integrase catalytic domain-containing protein [Aphis craccivora]|uniref:Integrase catalytic domain-containing protein n=1 Tax=Aphis craccivora TaxID=307492 RepID=A0A6G0Z9N1_APHCR|nr:Integrase catalytic domain-containing protein [Aphis craccivora]
MYSTILLSISWGDNLITPYNNYVYYYVLYEVATNTYVDPKVRRYSWNWAKLLNYRNVEALKQVYFSCLYNRLAIKPCSRYCYGIHRKYTVDCSLDLLNHHYNEDNKKWDHQSNNENIRISITNIGNSENTYYISACIKYETLDPDSLTLINGVTIIADLTKQIHIDADEIGILLTDQYPGINSKEFKRFLSEKSIQMVFTAINTPFSNGINERLNQTLVNKIRCKINEKKKKK